MDNESIQISLSAEEFMRFTQAIQTIHTLLSGEQVGRQPLGRFWTVDDRCRLRWPWATPGHRRRIRDVCLARYRERVGRYPYKLTGHANAAFMVEEENLTILDGAIDTVRNEVDGQDGMPLFSRRLR